MHQVTVRECALAANVDNGVFAGIGLDQVMQGFSSDSFLTLRLGSPLRGMIYRYRIRLYSPRAPPLKQGFARLRPMPQSPLIFDPTLIRTRRLRALPDYENARFLHREIAERMAERLDDLTARFPVTLATNGRGGVSADVLKGRGGIETLIEADACDEPTSRYRAARGAVIRDTAIHQWRVGLRVRSQ